ncbi:hypothetical protein CLAIMM_11757 [Cladophialophora immunda]|nr:hypothetical protein CLAIMM_11757 [Cladophialophora immunda]
MTTYEVPVDFRNIKDKTILITGCSTGIGRATAKLAYEHGAKLALADWNEVEAKNLLAELRNTDRLLFYKTDVSKWDNILQVFQGAWKKFGKIDAVISNAGINQENLLDEEIDEATGMLKAPSLKNLEVNLVAHIYVVKCAVHYFAKAPGKRSQIIMTGSAASYIDTPPLYQYCAAKAGLLGLMRAFRTRLISKNITINMIAPWMTISPMLPQAIVDMWGTLPANSPAGVAHALLLPVVDESINGKAFFVAGNKITELEDKIHECQHIWMGAQLSEDVDEGQRRLVPAGIHPEQKRDLVVRHEKTLHASTYTAANEADRNGPGNKRARKDTSVRDGQSHERLADVDEGPSPTGSLTGEDSADNATPVRGGVESTLDFAAGLHSSGMNQGFRIVLEPSSQERTAGNATKESFPGNEGLEKPGPVNELTDLSANISLQQIMPASAAHQENLPVQNGSLNEPSINTAPLPDITFANLDFFDPFLGLSHDALDFSGSHHDIEHLRALSPLSQLGDSMSQHREFAVRDIETPTNVTILHWQLPPPGTSIGSPTPRIQSQVQALSQTPNRMDNSTTLAKSSPDSAMSNAPSLPRVVHASQVRRASFGITQKARTALYADLAARLTREEMWDFDFPEALALEKCMRSYTDAFHVHLPIVHIPALLVEETPSPLILIMCAIGALYRLERKSATSMYRKASQAFTLSMSSWLAVNEPLLAIDNSPPWQNETTHPKSLPLWMMQTRFLLALFGTLNGSAGLIKTAFGWLGSQWIDCHLMLSSVSVGETGGETTWRGWLERESFKRLFYGVVILSHMLSTAYGLTPAFSTAQLESLEMPDDQDLWDASSEGQWLLLKQQRSRTTPLSLGEAVAKLMYDTTSKEDTDAAWNWSPFATCVVMHAVAMQIWYISSTRDLGMLPRGNGLHNHPTGLGASMQTEAALNRCRELLTNAKRANEATWSDEDGPMLFNCMAVLRVAYGRTFLPASTLDRFILLRETGSEIVDAIKKYLSIDSPRGESITRAITRSVEGLFVPVQAGVLWTVKTAALTWWVDHALAGWDTGLFVTRWIHAIEQEELHNRPVDDLEKKTMQEVQRLIEESQTPTTSSGSLAAAVARYWALFFTDTWVWGVTPRIGFVLQELARAYEESSISSRLQDQAAALCFA